MQRFVFNVGSVALIIFLFAGCAPKEYTNALTSAELLETKHEYEQAYDYYMQALKSRPNDKHIRQKLSELGGIIASALAEDAVQALEDKKYKTALDISNKARGYDEDNERVKDCHLEARKRYDEIQNKYSQVEDFKVNNNWVEAVNTLKDISESYNDDSDLGSRIEKCQNDGYGYFMKAGLEARKGGMYTQSLSYFESAESLKPSPEIQHEINVATRYVDADALYMRAKTLPDKSVLEAMDLLIQAKDLVADHEKINQLVIKLVPDWSPKIFELGKMFKESDQIEKAYDAFYKLKKINPDYPEADKCFEEVNSLYMKKNYSSLLEAQNDENFSLIMSLSQEILKVDSEFLDTKEIMTRAPIKAFNLFYQQGLSYMKTGNYGKAVLCFRSAEQQVAVTQLTGGMINEAWDQIRKESALKMVFLDFSQEIGDVSVSRYITEKIKKRVEANGGGKKFKNIAIALGATQGQNMITRSSLSNDIDWSSVLEKGYNAVITGRVKLLKQDTSVNSEWKTRKRTVRNIVDNEEYTRLTMRQAELRYGLKSGQWRKEKRMSRGQIEDLLESNEERLLTIPPKIEAEVEEETPYQLVRHTMTAYMQIDVEVLSPDGGHIWPVKHYEDTFQIEDSVVPPDLMSDEPRERMGDPLTLPSESAFKEQAIDSIVDKKIIPDLVEDFENYGMNFYNRAAELVLPKEGAKPGTTAFLDSIEEYYKFLACYQDKGEEDTLREEVEKKLETHISALWLIRKKNK